MRPPSGGARRGEEGAVQTMSASLTVALVECPSLRMYESFLARRGYTVVRPPQPAGALVVCADHAVDARIVEAGASFVGPKLVLGADPPPSWREAKRLDLPLLPLDLEQQLGKLARPAQPTAAGAGFSVLVVEDDATTAAIVSRTLQEYGFDTRICPGFSDVARALQQRPDFILMDLNLPGLSGEKLGEIIRVKRIPVAVFSSEPPARLEEAKTRIGAVAAFPKDSALAEVADWIRGYLERHRRA